MGAVSQAEVLVAQVPLRLGSRAARRSIRIGWCRCRRNAGVWVVPSDSCVCSLSLAALTPLPATPTPTHTPPGVQVAGPALHCDVADAVSKEPVTSAKRCKLIGTTHGAHGHAARWHFTALLRYGHTVGG